MKTIVPYEEIPKMYRVESIISKTFKENLKKWVKHSSIEKHEKNRIRINNKRKYKKVAEEYNSFVDDYNVAGKHYKEPQRRDGSTPRTQHERELELTLFCPSCGSALGFECCKREFTDQDIVCGANPMNDISIWRCRCGYKYGWMPSGCTYGML